MPKEEGDKLFMFMNGQGFSIKISNICLARNEIDGEQFLRDAINNPIKMHVYEFSSLRNFPRAYSFSG